MSLNYKPELNTPKLTKLKHTQKHRGFTQKHRALLQEYRALLR